MRTTSQNAAADRVLRDLAAAGGCGCPDAMPAPCQPALPTAPGVLRLSPTVVAKLLYFRQVRGQEAIAVGVPQPEDALLIVDARLRAPPSTLTDPSRPGGSAAASAEHVWILTHPGDDPTPTPSDEDAFAVLRGSRPWAVLCVLTPAGRHAARLEFHIGPGGRLRLPVCVDLSRPFAAADHAAWDREFAALPGPIRPQPGRRRGSPRAAVSASHPRDSRAAGRSRE